MDVIKQVKKYEKMFQKDRYDGKRNSQGFVIEKGSIPIMISAPHAVNHFREGEEKCADIYTGGIARFLGKLLKCHIIYSVYSKNLDPNYDIFEQSSYKQALSAYIKENGICVLIDLHGCKAERETAIDFGTIDESNSSLHKHDFILDLFQMVMKNALSDFLQESKKIIDKNVYFAAGNPNTITNGISKETGIPCIQVEINRLCREPENNSGVFLQLINGLADVIKYLSNVDWNAEHISVFMAGKSKTHFPQNKVELNDDYNVNSLECLFAKGISGESKLVEVRKNETLEKNVILLTNRLIEILFGGKEDFLHRPILLFKYKREMYGVGRPLAGIGEVTVTEGLYTELKSQEDKYLYMLYNKYTGTKMHINPVNYGKRPAEKVFLPYYYRELLGVEMPIEHMPEQGFLSLLEDMPSEEAKGLLKEAYEKSGSGDIEKGYILKEEYRDKVKDIEFRPDIELIRKPKKKKNIGWKKAEKIIEKVLTVLIGYSEFHLRVCRPRITDDNNKMARLSEEMMKLLGVYENDKIVVSFGSKKEHLRVMPIQKEDDLYGKKDMLIGLPAEVRTSLGISINDVVCVKRDMGYTFKRNTNQQLFSIFGTVLTIVTLSDVVWMRILLCMVAIPFVIYVTFAEERVKVENDEKKP